jgi:hypothetical protein
LLLQPWACKRQPTVYSFPFRLHSRCRGRVARTAETPSVPQAGPCELFLSGRESYSAGRDPRSRVGRSDCRTDFLHGNFFPLTSCLYVYAFALFLECSLTIDPSSRYPPAEELPTRVASRAIPVATFRDGSHRRLILVGRRSDSPPVRGDWWPVGVAMARWQFAFAPAIPQSSRCHGGLPQEKHPLPDDGRIARFAER